MKISSSILFLFFSIVSSAQKNREVRDSLHYYERMAGQMQHRVLDSIKRTGEYRTAVGNIYRLKAKTDSYGSFVLFMDIAQADFSKLNSTIVNAGYDKIEGPVGRIGFGMSFKSNRVIVDFDMIAISLNTKSDKHAGTPAQSGYILADFFSGGILDFGYDFIRSNRVNIYPYAGISARTADLEFRGTTTYNPVYTDITNLVANNPSATVTSRKLGYQAGMGFEIVTSKKHYAGGGILFVKAGMNRPVGKEKYKTLEGRTVDTGIEYGKWIISFGIKFFGR